MTELSLQSRWATQLAPEVISEILLECIPFAAETRFSNGKAFNFRPRAMFPVSLTHVCREWRQAAISFKKLWSFLDVDQDDDAARLEVYLARSGQYPLTIILTYPYADHEHTILGRLLRESSRWRTFFCDVVGLFDASPRSTGLTYAQWTALTFPELKNIVYFNSGHSNDSDEDDEDDNPSDSDSEGTDDGTDDEEDHHDEGDEDLDESANQQHNDEDDQANDIGAILEPEQPFENLLQSLPSKVAAQLRRFYSYCTDDEFKEEMLMNLDRATRIRCDFISTNNYFSGTEPGDIDLSLDDAEYASLATGDSEETPSRSFLFRNKFPKLRGLNLRVGREGHEVFTIWEGVPMPGYLAQLVVLRLCGRIVVSDDALTQIISTLSSLIDLTLELWGPASVNVVHLANLLAPHVPLIRVPRLEHLRLLPRHKGSSDALLPVLVARFVAPPGAPYARLRTFTLYHTVRTYWDESEAREIRARAPGALVERFKQAKVQHGWNIEIVELQSELWLEPANGEFMLDI